MEFPKLTSYKTAMGAMQLITVCAVAAALVLAGVLFFMYTKDIRAAYSSVWILDSRTSNVVKADSKGEITLNERTAEYKAHVIDFYEHFYQLDQFSYKRNVDHALNLVGNSGKELLADYKREDVLRRLQEMNMKLSVVVDSIFIDHSLVPAKGVCYAIQTFETPAGKAMRRMDSKFDIVDLQIRTIENAHACLIENFKITDNTKFTKPE